MVSFYSFFFLPFIAEGKKERSYDGLGLPRKRSKAAIWYMGGWMDGWGYIMYM